MRKFREDEAYLSGTEVGKEMEPRYMSLVIVACCATRFDTLFRWIVALHAVRQQVEGGGLVVERSDCWYCLLLRPWVLIVPFV